MKKSILLLFAIALFISCGNEKKEKTEESLSETQETADTVEDLAVLIGKQEINTIKSAPHNEWFMEHYRYSPDQQKLRALQPVLEGKTMTIFMGTWCYDSQVQVPALLNILDAIKYDTSTITLIAVSEEKDTPEGLEDGLNILYVPTIILYEGEEELGRIVEYPLISLEADLLAIANGEEYRHAYYEEEKSEE